MRVEFHPDTGDGRRSERHHLPLPSGKYVWVGLYIRPDGPPVIESEMYGVPVDDLPALAEGLLALWRSVKYPDGILSADVASLRLTGAPDGR